MRSGTDGTTTSIYIPKSFTEKSVSTFPDVLDGESYKLLTNCPAIVNAEFAERVTAPPIDDGGLVTIDEPTENNAGTSPRVCHCSNALAATGTNGKSEIVIGGKILVTSPAFATVFVFNLTENDGQGEFNASET